VFVDRDPPSGFMRIDRRCLERSFDVRPLVYPGRLSARFVLDAFRAVAAADTTYAFFGSEHALVPAVAARLLRKRFVLVPAGYDYACLPERGYGLAARGRGWLPKLVGRLSHVALPISEQIRWEFLALVPSAAGRTTVAYLAVDPAEWADPGVERDPDLVVTVGGVPDEQTWGRKGLDRFVDAARRDPDRTYAWAGAIDDEVAARVLVDLPPNLRCLGRLDHDELVALLWSAGVYAQLSWHETFGVAVAEAMLCGGVPVVSTSPALNEVVAGHGEVAADPADDVAAIARAAARGRTTDRAALRRYVATRFSLDARASQLRDAVNG
jgi:glycosyltransferase involved in cell wall biosynthesis